MQSHQPPDAMRLAYVLLSPTFGMHQYTADLANRAARMGSWKLEAGSSGDPAFGVRQPAIHLVTTTTLPRDRYSPAVEIHTPVTTHGTGFAREGLDIRAYRRAQSAVLAGHAAIAHFTGVHLWNLPLIYALRRRGVPVIHTLHDLDPHHGVRFGPLIRLWNRLLIASGCHLLVHGRRYRQQLIAGGIPADRVTYTPLLHGFLAADRPWPPAEAEINTGDLNPDRSLNVLFFGRVEAYKGIETLLAAWDGARNRREPGESALSAPDSRLIIAGAVARGLALPPLPAGVELRDQRVGDDQAEAVVRSAALLVLPYLDATQSALVAAAYACGLPVIVTDAGALSESVIPGETGWVVPAGDVDALAAALQEALADPARLRRMGAAGRTWFDARRREEGQTLAEMYASLFCQAGIHLR